MPPDALPVHLNREQLHGLEVPDAYEAAGSFDVALLNHGESVHVHLHLDDDLSEVAAIDASNHFIDGDSRRAVRVQVREGGSAAGKLKIASAYGAETRYIDVRVVEPEESEDHVEVDESLAEPQPKAPAESAENGAILDDLVDNRDVVVFALGILALVLAAVAAVVLEETVVLLGALVVLAGVLGAMYLIVDGS